MRLEQHHDRADGPLRSPAVLDLFDTRLAQPRHLFQALRLVVEHAYAVEPKRVHDPTRVDRTNPRDDAGAEILGEPLDRTRLERHQDLGLELLAVSRIDHELPGHSHDTAS